MNMNAEIISSEVLSRDWYVLKKYTLREQRRDGTWVTQSREVYDRGNGATILLYSQSQRTVVLTRQFRLPTFLNGNPDGRLIETCAGLLDGDHPAEAIVRETEEETGYKIRQIEKVFEAYMSPGSVTEILHFYIGKYDRSMQVGAGGGVPSEENIEVLELGFDEALAMITDGRIKDAKTIMLLQHAVIRGLLSYS